MSSTPIYSFTAWMAKISLKILLNLAVSHAQLDAWSIVDAKKMLKK